MIRATFIAIVILISGCTFAQIQKLEFAVSSKGEVYALGQKQTALNGAIINFEISPDGRFLGCARLLFNQTTVLDIVQGKQSNPKKVFTIFDSKTKKLVDIELKPTVVIEITHLNNDSFYISLSDHELFTTESYLTSLSSSPVKISLPDGESSNLAVAHPAKNCFSVLYNTSRIDKEIYNSIAVFDFKGQIIKNTHKVYGQPTTFRADPKTSNLILSNLINKEPFLYDPLTGKVSPYNVDDYSILTTNFETAQIEFTHKELGKQKFIILSSQFDEKEFSELPAEIKSLPKPIISISPAKVTIAENNSMVYIADTNGISIIPLLPANIDTVANLIRRSEIAETMATARKVALGIHIYASDYDDCFPLANKWDEAVWPYLMTNELTSNFHYMLNGDEIGKISDVSKTVLGEIVTKYGRAVVYADSSVKWFDAPKPFSLYSKVEKQVRTKFVILN